MAEKRAGGDDLDDDFYVYEPITDEVDDDDEHVEKKASTPKVTPKAKETKKRKADDEDAAPTPKKTKVEPNGEPGVASADKKAKRKAQKEKLKAKLKEKDLKHEELIANGPEAQAKLFAETIKKTYKDLSDLELEPLFLSGEHFGQDHLFTSERKAENLAEYIKTIEPEWSTVFGAEKKKKKGKESAKGSPVLLIITSAGIRSADVFRALGDFNKECRVGKLFAKHMKVPEQVAFLKGTHIKIAVGTPNRLCKLIEEGALKLDRLKYVLVDATYRDVKNRSLFQMTELVSDLLTLYKTHCLNRIKEGHTKMLMF
eukprot:Colp12_sorted_trinity150504_noHs@1668